MKKQLLISAIAFLSFQFSSCGLLQTVAVKSTAGIIDYGMAAIFEESDLQLAESAIPGNLVLVEALHKADPENAKLSLLLVQGYTGYALGFVEDTAPDRARLLYDRARRYGLDVLRRNKDFNRYFDDSPSEFPRGLASFSDEDVPLIFWTANAWGNMINMSISDPAALGDLSKVNAMMEFVIKRQESFYYGSAHLYFGMILSTVPKNLGGKPDSARQHFERCFELNQRKMLLAQVYMARSYCVQTQNKDLFIELLTAVEEAPIDILPGEQLVNAIAKRKAKRLLERTDELFF